MSPHEYERSVRLLRIAIQRYILRGYPVPVDLQAEMVAEGIIIPEIEEDYDGEHRGD